MCKLFNKNDMRFFYLKDVYVAKCNDFMIILRCLLIKC